MNESASGAIRPDPPRLLDLVRDTVRRRGYSASTEESYTNWVKRYVLFHSKRHPREMGAEHVQSFLSHLARRERVASSTQNQAFSALLFLYKHVLKAPLSDEIKSERAKVYKHDPTVLTAAEVRRLFEQMSGTPRLMAQLTYGAGLRAMELHSLRVGDLDFESKRIHVRDSKGHKDRSTLMPSALVEPLRSHLDRVSVLHTEDLMLGYGLCVLPRAYHLKSPHASKHFRWQFVFPSSRLFHDERTGLSGRWHVGTDALQKAIRRATDQAGIHRRVTVHTLCHSFATHLLQNGCDIRVIQTLLGHANVNTTMIYAHIADNLGLSAVSPLDRLSVAL